MFRMPSRDVAAFSLRPELVWDVHVAIRRDPPASPVAQAFFRHMLSAYQP